MTSHPSSAILHRAAFLAAVLLLAVTSLSLGVAEETQEARSQAPEPPIASSDQALYHPDAPELFDSLEEYVRWYTDRPVDTDRHRFDPSKLTVGLHLHLASYQRKNSAAVDALVRAIERRGHNTVTLVAGAGLRLVDAFVREDEPVIDVLLFSGERLNRSDLQAGRDEAARLGVPVLGSLTHSELNVEGFAASPNGLHPDLTPRVVGAEQDGIIEPMVVAASARGSGHDAIGEPLPAQIEWRAERALAWAKLGRTPNADKRVVLTYWSQGGGKANVGGDPDDFLDVPASLIALLDTMHARGYAIGAGPRPDRDALARRMAREASNVGTWAPGELAARVRRGEVTLIPEDTYRAWFETLPDDRRADIVEMWGPPPGDVMVHTDASGRRFLAIPAIELGNILIAPHPDWGYLQDHKALMSTGALPPHHQYVAFFLWLQREWQADAWVSLFSNLVLQPGKSEGPAADDHVALLLGALPHIHPERLGSSGGVSQKRKAMAQTVGWYNLVAPSDAREQLSELRALITRYTAQADAAVRADTAPLIRAELQRRGIDRALDVDVATAAMTEVIEAARSYLDDLDRAHTPHGSKVLGEVPEGDVLANMVAGMLGADLRAAIAPLTSEPEMAARRLARAVVLEGQPPKAALVAELGQSTPAAEAALAPAIDYAGRLRAAPREITGILDALGGRWIEPGPMDEPLRRPDSVPPGRALYHFDQAAIPTPEAEATGVRQAEALIAAHRERHDGAYPTSHAFVLWSGEIARTHGVTEAQVLHLLGTRAVRDARGEVTGLELIPREALGRPRVDVLVTTSGTYRDHYQDMIDLIAEATRLAAASPEPDNPVATATRATRERLEGSGESPERAAALARARIFSPAPGAYSPGIQFLAKSGDHRGDEARMADLYTRRMGHAYGAGLYGEAARQAFEQNLARMEAATLPRSSHVNGLLDHPMSAGFLGGLNLGARAVTGKDVELYISNLRDPDHTSIEPAARALQTELGTRYFNRSWLETMTQHGYEGARTMMYLTDHLDLWSSTAAAMVSTEDWAKVKSVYVDDSLDLELDAFFERHNPHAQQVLLANLLGAAARGHWEASDADLAQVARRLAESSAEHGIACEAAMCRNPALTAFVDKALASVPGGAELSAGYRAAIDDATSPGAYQAPDTTTAAPAAADPGTASVAPDSAAPATRPAPAAAAPATAAVPVPTPPLVTGRVLEDTTNASDGDPLTSPRHVWWWLAGAATVLIASGWWRAGRLDYSARSADTGSTRMARRAGR